MTSLSEPLLFALRSATGVTLVPGSVSSVGGGSIHACYRVAERSGRAWFLKLNEADCAPLFAAEAAGLAELAHAQAVRVPAVIGHGVADEVAWLLLEYIELEQGHAAAATRLGERLALQHRRGADHHGWHRDNSIGTTPQRNGWQDDWLEFWRRERLGFQLHLAARHGHGAAFDGRDERLLAALPLLFAGHRPAPSLLHGDLWAGNWGMTRAGEPVIFDPAVYYGDRETDLAMSELFGGFPREFYVAYQHAWPLPPGYPVRRDVYNLYHVLNHLNLFGGAYLAQAIGLMDRVLAAVREHS
ncbi:MAG: fructosamine kinase family protein [Gammaproteobacteria bacterium]|nr:fructosamine kinase family protein [Gammaproteobacteria bacterium]